MKPNLINIKVPFSAEVTPFTSVAHSALGFAVHANISSDWEFFSATPDGQSFHIDGFDVWKHDWRDTKERVPVQDPLYHQDFTFHVYEIGSAGRVVTFAAGEFSNCMWGFYVTSSDTSQFL